MSRDATTGRPARNAPDAAPLWTYLHIALQVLSLATVLVVGLLAFWDALEHLSAPEYALAAGLPAIICVGFGWFMPRSFYKPSEDQTGPYDPSRQIRGWVVAVHAVVISAFTASMWMVLQATRDGALAPSQAYRTFLILCGLTFVASVILRLVVRTPPAV